MTASREIKYRRRDIVPEPRCYRCSLGIPLDTNTYLQYNGPVRCPHCDFLNHMTFAGGTLLDVRPVLDDKFLLPEVHAIPTQPLEDYEEATRCFAAYAWKACAVMTRRAVQAALLAKCVKDARPRSMIDEAYNKHHLLTEKQYQLAIAVTFFGGKGAHPEDSALNEVGEIEASAGLWATKTLLLALFPQPKLR